MDMEGHHAAQHGGASSFHAAVALLVLPAVLSVVLVALCAAKKKKNKVAPNDGLPQMVCRYVSRRPGGDVKCENPADLSREPMSCFCRIHACEWAGCTASKPSSKKYCQTHACYAQDNVAQNPVEDDGEYIRASVQLAMANKHGPLRSSNATRLEPLPGRRATKPRVITERLYDIGDITSDLTHSARRKLSKAHGIDFSEAGPDDVDWFETSTFQPEAPGV